MSDSGGPTGFVLAPPRARVGGVAGKLARIVRLAGRCASLGSRRVDRARLFGGTFALLLAHRLGAARRLKVTVSITAFGRSARCTVGHFDHLRVLEGIFLDGDLAVEPLQAPRTIVDLGSNIGLSILYFRMRFPAARIVGVEPDPEAFALLRTNVAQLANVTLLQAAVSDREGTTTLWSAPGAAASALEHTHAAQRPVAVPVRTLEGVLEDAAVDRVDILKLVVEGSEFRALRSLRDLNRLDAIAGEIVFVEGDRHRTPSAFRELLANFDVRLYEDQGDGFWRFHARRRVSR